MNRSNTSIIGEQLDLSRDLGPLSRGPKNNAK